MLNVSFLFQAEGRPFSANITIVVMCCRPATGLVLVVPEVRVGDALPVGILYAERLFQFADGPGRRKAARRHRSQHRVIAGLSGFFTLIHVLVRPER